MKKAFYYLLTISLVSSVSFGITSCGGDDDGSSSVIDGVNVNNGKKLTRLEILPETGSSTTTDYNYKLRVLYDSKGRLSSVIWTNGEKYENGKFIESEIELMKIDYDLRLVNIYPSLKYMFSLNDKGYISQIASGSCTYDSYGYLTGVESLREICTLAYSEGELIKSLVSNLQNGNMQLYYMFYGENSSTGELMFYMNGEKHKTYGTNPIQAVMCFIAYQSGLFGKITNHCRYLSKSNETSAVLERNNEQNSNKFVVRCKFTYE